MYTKNNVNLNVNYNVMKTIEETVIRAIKKKEYTLNAVNSYGENLLHISTANNCLNIMKEILQEQDKNAIDRKNKFGWTPLMLAIRNRNIEAVKLLLEKNANVNTSTYLGMSIFGLAAAINKNMFETVYKICPSALLNSVNDDITPLCIAAMRNDKDLFFRLLQLGFDASKTNEYTKIMIKQSTIPGIVNLSETLDSENYWSDSSDNILVESNLNCTEQSNFLKSITENKEKYVSQTNHNTQEKLDSNLERNYNDNNNITTNLKKYSKPNKLNLTVKNSEPNLISPTLSCTLDEILTSSPNIYFVQNNCDKVNNVNRTTIEDKQVIEDKIQCSKNNEYVSESGLQRLQSIRPPDLIIQNIHEDLNATLSYIPEFSPMRSPNVPQDIEDENVFGENTPTPPRYKTPPRGMILNSREGKMIVLLRRYGLSQHVPIFLEQEVDIDLFITLTDNDLIEIGINDESDRKVILDVIMDYKKTII